MDGERLCPGFEELCMVHADLTEPSKAAPLHIGVFNQGYKVVKVRNLSYYAALAA
jgi:hypothetical protein